MYLPLIMPSPAHTRPTAKTPTPSAAASPASQDAPRVAKLTLWVQLSRSHPAAQTPVLPHSGNVCLGWLSPSWVGPALASEPPHSSHSVSGHRTSFPPSRLPSEPAEAIRVEDLDMVKIIPFSFDTLLAVSSMFFASHTQDSCMCCHSDLAALGGSAPRCSGCQAAVYCSDACRSEDAPLHSSYCALCDDLRDVLSIDFERFIEYIPFRVSPS